MTKIKKEGWEIKKLGEIVNVRIGKLDANAASEDGAYPFFTCSKEPLRISNYSYDCECVLIAGNGDLNVKYYKGKFDAYQRTYIITLKEGISETTVPFVHKFFELYIENLRQKSIGGIIKYIKLGNITNARIPLPPLPIQQRIVEELDEINAIISAKKQQLSKLDELAQSIFYDIFGDPVANEKGWEVKKLGEETTDIKYGTSSPASPNGQYKYLRMCNISYDGHLDFSDLKYIDVPDAEIEKCIVRYGDILFNRTNSLELIGKTCMFDVEEPMVIAGYIIRVRLTDKLHPRYVSVAFNLPSMKKLLRNMAKGAVNQANINSKELASINIPLPPLPLQEAFAARVSAIEEQKSSIAASIEKMQTLLDARMQEYFG
ncbi:MAG: restriction endonuclease subunit S [Bacteroidales bacterium]|nr:restriction endonuclease subunit S [Bacteroidales bacterium]